MRRAHSLEKTLMLGKIKGGRRRGRQMVGWHHWLNGHELEKIPWTEESGGLQSIELQRVRHSSVQSFSRVWLLVTHWLQHAGPPCPSSTPGAYWNPYPSSGWYHLILCCPLLLPPSILLSIRDFSNESILCLRWLNYWNFRFSISPSNEYSGLIFRTDWLDLLAV